MEVRLDSTQRSTSPQGSSFNEVWPQIEPLVKKIFTNDTLSKSDWQEIFWKVHLTCMWDPHSAYQLQQRLRDLFNFYIKTEQQYIFSNAQTDLSLMKAYMVAWKRFMFYYTYVPLPFAPLEKLVFNRGGPIGDNHNKTEETDNFLRLSMMEMWVLHIFSRVSDQLVQGAMLLVDAERKNIHSDPQLIVGVKESCVNLCKYLPNRHYIYRNNFESVYLASIESFYQTKGQEYLNEHGVLNYMKWVDQKIKEEIDRGNRYLESHSLPKVIDSCVSTLVARYKEMLADKFLDLIKCRDIFNLNLMFTLLDRIDNGIDQLLEKFKKYITQMGKENLQLEAMTIAQDSEKYIENLLNLFNMATSLIQDAFNSDSRFLTTRDMSINMLINDKTIFALAFALKQTNSNNNSNNNNNNNNNENNTEDNQFNNTNPNNNTRINGTNPNQKKWFESRNAELFANYCDILLRRTNVSRHLSSEQIETKLKNVILLLKYLEDKDVFMKFYKAHLTRRLILDVSIDLDKEEMMVNWLREVGMPADYVNKISRMFQDLKVSDDFNRQYKLCCDKSVGDLINVKILNSSTWSRNMEKINVSLPSEIEELLPKIENFYKNKHNGRNLFWHHQFSYGIVTFHSNNGSYDLDVTSYQAAVLFAWNDRPNDSISFETLMLSTQLPNLELRKTLWSLVSNAKLKTQLLLVDNHNSNNNTQSQNTKEKPNSNPKSNQSYKSFKDFRDDNRFKLNLNFSLYGKTGRAMKRGRFNLIGRLQLQTEKFREDEFESIMKLRILRTQEAIMKIMKMRKTTTSETLHKELSQVLKEMFVPNKQLIKEQLEWLIENDYIIRDQNDPNILTYC